MPDMAYRETTILDQDEFEKQYPPIHRENMSGIWEFDEVKDYPNNQVWSIVESCSADTDKLFALPGYRIVNKIGYIVTEVPWTDDNIEATYYEFPERDSDHLVE